MESINWVYQIVNIANYNTVRISMTVQMQLKLKFLKRLGIIEIFNYF